MRAEVIRENPDDHSDRYRLVSQIGSLVVMTGGTLVILAWLFDWPAVKGVLPGLATMKFNTALCFILTGAALWFRIHPQSTSGWQWTVAMGCAGLAGAIAAASLAEYIWGWNLGIDELIVRDLGADPGMVAPGRMAPVTGACFVFLSTALMTLDWKPLGLPRPAEALTLLATFLALVAVEGYILGVSALYRFFLVAHIALNTAILFVILGVGILCTRTMDGIMARLASSRMGGYLIRQVLPLILILPTFLAWVVLHGHRLLRYTVEVDLAIFAAISMALFALVVILSGRKLDQLHVELEERNESNARFATIVESSPSAVVGFAPDGRIEAWNRGAENVLGYSAQEAVGTSLFNLIPVDQLVYEKQMIERILHGETVELFESARRRKDGGVITVSISMATLRSASGHITGFSQVARDITQQVKDLIALQEAREQLKIIVERLHEGLVVADTEGRLIHWNPAALSMHGLHSFDDWNRLLPEFADLYQIFTLDGREIPVEQWPIARVLRGEELRGLEVRLFHRKELWEKIFSYSGALARDSYDRKIAFVTIHDITARARAEEKVRETLKHVTDLQTALDEHAIVAITDPKGKITYVNDKFCAISKYTRAELIGQDHRILNSGHHPKEFFRDLWSTIRHGRIWHGEIKNCAKDGSIYWVNTTIMPFLDDQGKPFQYVAIRADITDLKSAEERLRHQAEDLARSNRDLEQFAYVASHDLQEPLRAVAGCMEIFKRRYDNALDAKANDLIKHAVDGSRRMQLLIEGLLAFSRVTTHGGEIKSIPLDDVVAHAIKNLESSIHEANATIIHDPLPTLRADPIQMELVFQNLIGNAIKFHGKESPLIHVSARRDKEHWIISVKDNGIGIDPQYFERIFVIFQRLHTRQEYPGTGIGLSLCKKIVERHGGAIEVISAPGEGSTFTIRLLA